MAWWKSGGWESRDVEEAEINLIGDSNRFTWTIVDSNNDSKEPTNEEKILDLISPVDTDVSSIIAEGEKLGLSKEHIRVILSKLKDSKLIESPERGKYKRI